MQPPRSQMGAAIPFEPLNIAHHKETERMDSEDAIYRQFKTMGLSYLDAIERLQAIGYEPKDAETLVGEWADDLDAQHEEAAR